LILLQHYEETYTSERHANSVNATSLARGVIALLDNSKHTVGILIKQQVIAFPSFSIQFSTAFK